MVMQEPTFEQVRVIASNIIDNYPVDQAIDLLLSQVVPHLSALDPMVTFGTKDGYTFMTHGYTKHPQCSRRCLKDCVINWMEAYKDINRAGDQGDQDNMFSPYDMWMESNRRTPQYGFLTRE